MSLFLYTSLKCFPEMLIFYATLVIGSAFACNRKVHKYGNSTTGESWDIVVDEETYYE